MELTEIKSGMRGVIGRGKAVRGGDSGGRLLVE